MVSFWYYTINMEENTLFQNPQSQDQAVSQSPPLSNQGNPPPESPSQQPSSQPVFPPSSSPSPAPEASSPPPPPPEEGSLSRFSTSFPTIIKIAVGAIVIILVLIIFFGVVVPFLSKGKEKNAEISYWGLWEDQNILKPVIDDFNKKYPNIKVNYTKQDIKQYREKLTTRIQNGTGPDVFLFHNTWLPMFSDVLLPVPDNVISKKDFESSFYPVAKKDLEKNAAIYGIPTEIDTLSLYTNREIFESAGVKVPDNWQDFINISRQLTVVDEAGRIKTAGASLGTFDNINHAPDIISMLFVQNGANIRNLSSTSRKASDALEFYTSFAKGDQKVWDSTLEQSMLAFAKGELAMYFGYSWDYFIIKSINPDFKFDIHPVPKIENRDITIASYWASGVSSKTKYQKEAFLFLKFLTSEETQEKLFTIESKTRLFGEPYPRINLLGKLKGSVAYPFVSQAKRADSSFFASDTYDDGLNSRMNVYLGNAVRSINSENTSAETAISTLSEGVSQILSQYGQ